MIIAAATVRLYAPWVHSLKDKRMVVKSLVDRVRNRFNASISEVDEQDTHRTIVLGIACVSGAAGEAGRAVDRIIEFIEAGTEAEITDIVREMR
jgi:uncharacterized protein YlxP (DUF503 family)